MFEVQIRALGRYVPTEHAYRRWRLEFTPQRIVDIRLARQLGVQQQDDDLAWRGCTPVGERGTCPQDGRLQASRDRLHVNVTRLRGQTPVPGEERRDWRHHFAILEGSRTAAGFFASCGLSRCSRVARDVFEATLAGGPLA
jgi:hypothetical protein